MERNGAGEMDERRSIRESGKGLKKYGSTAKHMTRNETLVKHLVSKTDTLQGIALKYGVTMEQIRRLNRLWASDSLFLREHLLIPVPVDSGAGSIPNDNVPSTDADPARHATSPSSLTSSIEEDNSIDDFLAKMDFSIASMKKEVKRAQGNSEFCNEGLEDIYVQQRRRTAGRSRNSQQQNHHQQQQQQQQVSSTISTTSSSEASSSRPSSSSGDVHSLPSAVVMTQGRRVKTSLQRLQQQQDEMFQL